MMLALLGLLACGAPKASPPPSPAAAPAEPEDLVRLRAAMALDEAGDVAGARAALEALARDAADPRARDFAAKRVAELAIIGRPAGPINVTRWYTPRSPTLADAPATLLVFFESWCPHCQEELPKLPDRACRWGPRGLQIVAVTKQTRGATDTDVQSTLVEAGLFGLAVGHEREGAMSEAYAVTGIPAAALVKDGVVLWRGHPAQLDDATLGRLLGAEPSTEPCAPVKPFGR